MPLLTIGNPALDTVKTYRSKLRRLWLSLAMLNPDEAHIAQQKIPQLEEQLGIKANDVPGPGRTRLGRLHFYGAIQPRSDSPQVIDKTAEKFGSPGKIRTCNPSVNSFWVRTFRVPILRTIGNGNKALSDTNGL